MARFPCKEAEVFAIAREMMTGLAADASAYPSPLVIIADLGAASGAYMPTGNVEKC
ncbi:MAG: hypothetical protein IIB57_13845 [Planctomycetes bacterium]|nr:hypothetical protein [Planctomycetota bacterium]